MRQQAKHITTHSQNNKFDAYILKTYWRMKLYRTLHEPLLITEVIDTGDSFSFTSISFDDYWNDVHVSLNNYIQELKISWYSYINSDFDNVEPYCNAYLRLINKLPFVKTLSQEQDKFILERALGFENFVFRKKGNASAFAAATTSFRNPVFLSLQQRGLRQQSQNVPSLLPLIVALDKGKSSLFYHYRKQRIIKNSDHSLLFFPTVELNRRSASFSGLEGLTQRLVDQWDSRVPQRARLLAKKVIVPLLDNMSNENNTLNILDIGSGAGHLTSSLITNIIQSGCLRDAKIEAHPVKAYFAS